MVFSGTGVLLREAWIRPFLAIILGFPLSGFSENGLSQYASRLWQVEDGLPHDIVRAVAQTRDGYLWVGTHEGLTRFDGVRFQPLEFPELVHESITALYEARDGSLWIGSENGLFRLFNGDLHPFARGDGFSGGSVRTIREDLFGNIWVASGEGVAQLRADGSGQRFETVLDGTVWSLHVDDEGGVWGARASRLHYLRDGRKESFSSDDGLLEGKLRHVYPGRDGGVWIGTTLGMSFFKDGEFVNYPKGTGPPAFVNAIFEDRDGTMWIGTYEGLSRFVDGEFVDEFTEDGTSYFVHCITEDREGNLWVGSDGGLRRLAPHRFVTYNKRHGLSHNRTRALAAGDDGSIWIAVWGGGLHRFRDGELSSYSAVPGFASEFIYSMYAAHDGLWVGMDYNGGLYRVRDGQSVHFGEEKGLRARLISAIYEDRSGAVWIGSEVGLYRFRDGVFTRYATDAGLSHSRVNVLYEGTDGTLWIGTESGLTSWNGEFNEDERFAETAVLSIYEDGEGVLWVGTRGAGLGRVGRDGVRTFTTAHGIGGDSISAIAEDSRGYLWMHGGRSIFRVGKKELDEVAAGTLDTVNAVTFGRKDGIASSGQYRHASQPAAVRGLDGRLWFRTPQGVVVVNPQEFATNTLPPPIVIEQVIADKKRVRNAAHDTRNREPETLVFPPGRGELEIHYTALSFTAPEKNRFRFKLEGVDSEWKEAAERRVAYYNNLRPGSYTFRVTGSNNHGVWNETGAQLVIVLKPNFWQTWWFYGLCGLFAAGGVGGTVRHFLQRRHRRNLLRLEQQHAIEKERGRIAQDMHDDLGARLSEILILSNLPRQQPAEPARLTAQLRRISAAARDLVDNLDAIVWAVNPRHDSLESFVTYIQEYVSNYMEAHSTRCGFDIPIDVPEAALSSQVRHELFLVVKEAINNLVKHAQASKVRVSFLCDTTYLSLVVEDDGIGFSLCDISGFGNGLGNMEQRMSRIGGRFELSSKPGEGVRIRLVVPIEP